MYSFMPWLSGFIDGEGTIGISKRKSIPKYKSYHETYRAYISISSTSEETMNFIKDELDKRAERNIGHLGGYDGKKINHKKYFLFSIAKYDDLIWLLPQITPFLVMKNKQARLLDKWINLRLPKLNLKHIGSNISLDEIYIYEELKKLNRRGK